MLHLMVPFLIAVAVWWGMWIYTWYASGAISFRRVIVLSLLGTMVIAALFSVRLIWPNPETRSERLHRELAENPLDVNARLELVEFDEGEGRMPGEALDLLDEGIHLTHGDTRLRMKRAAYHLRLREWKPALADLDTLLATDSTDANVWYNYGIAERGLGQDSIAVKAFKQSLALQGPVDAHFYLGLLYEASGDTTAALEQYRLRWVQRRLDIDDRTAVAAQARIRRLEEGSPPEGE